MQKKHISTLLITILILFSSYQLEAREFLNAFLHINLGLAYGIPMGTIPDYEKDTFTFNGTPSHYETIYNITVDFLPIPPFLLGSESNAIRIGIRGGYRFHYLTQSVSITSATGDEDSYRGDLMTYRSWMIGPVIYYAPFITTSDLSGNYKAEGGFTFFVLYGKTIDGNIDGYPLRRELGEAITNYNTDFSAHKLDIGIGGAISFCSINLGLNIYYTILYMNMETEIYSTIGRTATMKEVCFEVYLGFPIEWDRIPLLY